MRNTRKYVCQMLCESQTDLNYYFMYLYIVHITRVHGRQANIYFNKIKRMTIAVPKGIGKHESNFIQPPKKIYKYE